MLGARPVRGLRELIDAMLVEEGWVAETVPPDRSVPLGPARQVRRLGDAPDDALVLLDDLTRYTGTATDDLLDPRAVSA